MTRRSILFVVVMVALAAWLNSHLPSEEAMRQLPNGGTSIACYEDGSCSDGYCNPDGLCAK